MKQLESDFKKHSVRESKSESYRMSVRENVTETVRKEEVWDRV